MPEIIASKGSERASLEFPGFGCPFPAEEKRSVKSPFVGFVGTTIYDIKGSTDNLYIHFEIHCYPRNTKLVMFGLKGPADDPSRVNPDFEKIYSVKLQVNVIEQHLLLYQDFAGEIRIKETDPRP